MIAPGDGVRLPPGVALRDGALEDSVRGAAWPLNEAAELVLARAGAATIADTASALAERFAVPADTALADVRAFCADLNSKLLLNIEPRSGALALGGRWLSEAVLLLPLGALPRLPLRRSAIDTRTAARAVATVARRLSLQALGVAALLAALATLLFAGAGVPELELPLLLAASAASGLVAHEAGHAAALRGVPSCLAHAGLRTFVLHAPLPALRRALVALAGPAAATVLGWVALLVAFALALDDLALAATLLTTHALGLTVAAEDGRTACTPS